MVITRTGPSAFAINRFMNCIQFTLPLLHWHTRHTTYTLHVFKPRHPMAILILQYPYVKEMSFACHDVPGRLWRRRQRIPW